MSTVTRPASGRRLHAAAVAAFIAMVGMLAGCSAGAESAADYGGTDIASGEDFPASAEFESDMAFTDGESTGGEFELPPVERAVVITGVLYMTVEDPIAAADQAAGIVRTAGGRIDARSETAPDERYGGSATMTLRIPADRLDAVIDDLRPLGTVDELSTDSYDVTVEVTDLEARISTLRASTLRIEGLLTNAEGISDIIRLEDELASRQAELEGLEARQRGLNDQVSLSTINLSLTTEPVVIMAVEEDRPENFWDGLAAGWSGLVSFVSSGLIVVGILLPWLGVLALITFAIIGAVRLGRSRAGRTNFPPPAPHAETAAPAKTAKS